MPSFSRASLCACLLSSIACGGQNASNAADAGPGDASVDGPIVDATPDQATGDASAFDSGGPVNVPLSVGISSKGTMSFTLPVEVGGSPLDTLFDTGSSGLRILAGSVPDSAFASTTTTQVTYSYHSGELISGVVATANISVGALHTPAPIPVMLVQTASCTSSSCGAIGSIPLSEAFGSIGAILGVGMRCKEGSGQVGSPIAQLEGTPAFVVKAPAYGGMQATLELFPAASEIASFKSFSLPPLSDGAALTNGTPAFDDRYGLPACLDDQTSGVDYCVPAELDTGNGPIYIEWPAHGDAGNTELPPSESVEVELGPADAGLEEYAFTVGPTPTPGIDEVLVESASGAGFMNLGTGVFLRYDVYFDPTSGVVGFGPH
jgi:hypothetical protein